MYSFYNYEELARQNQKLMEIEIQHGMLVLEAQKGSFGYHRSKTLVKLAKLLILAGEWIMTHADHDLPSTFPGATLQNY